MNRDTLSRSPCPSCSYVIGPYLPPVPMGARADCRWENTQQHGITAKDCEKLAEAGFHTIESIAFTPRKLLVAVKGISEAKADKILSVGERGRPLDFPAADFGC